MSSANKHVLIVGGGIGGMAAALALLQRGFDVDVYEQASEFREIGAGVQISPNGSRTLAALGVFQRLRDLSCKPSRKEIRHWQSGKAWELFDLDGFASSKYGFPYLTVYRPDLLQVLTDAVRALKPRALHLKARCVGVEETGDCVVLRLDGGETASGDVLVGADGVHSSVRRALFADGDAQFAGLVAWRGLIPMERLPLHLRAPVGVNWVGPGGHVVHYPLQGGKTMNFVGTREVTDWDASTWRLDGSAEECAAQYKDWHPDVLAMIEQVPSFSKWALLERPFLPHWSRGRATLLGDACHPTLPSFAQGANMALEDGVVLARCLEGHADVEKALGAYERLRMDRTYRMVRAATDFMPNFNHPSLADAAESEAFITRVWRPDAVSERYDWLFGYDPEAVSL